MAELVSFDDCAVALEIDMALRNFFHAHRPSSPADKGMGTLRNFPGRHNRKPKFQSNAEPSVAPEVKAISRNIACPAQDRLELRACTRASFRSEGLICT